MYMNIYIINYFLVAIYILEISYFLLTQPNIHKLSTIWESLKLPDHVNKKLN